MLSLSLSVRVCVRVCAWKCVCVLSMTPSFVCLFQFEVFVVAVVLQSSRCKPKLWSRSPWNGTMQSAQAFCAAAAEEFKSTESPKILSILLETLTAKEAATTLRCITAACTINTHTNSGKCAINGKWYTHLAGTQTISN